MSEDTQETAAEEGKVTLPTGHVPRRTIPMPPKAIMSGASEAAVERIRAALQTSQDDRSVHGAGAARNAVMAVQPRGLQPVALHYLAEAEDYLTGEHARRIQVAAEAAAK